MFQFHKVRLKDGCGARSVYDCSEFQFHKVRLKAGRSEGYGL